MSTRSATRQAVGLETEAGLGVRPWTRALTEAGLMSISSLLCWEVIGLPLDYFWPRGIDKLPTIESQQITINSPYACVRGAFCPKTGARVYVDHFHPEYSCPEAVDPRQAVLHAVRGQREMENAAIRIATDSVRNPAGHRPVVYGNNTSQSGESFGGHVSVSFDARIRRRLFVRPLASFFPVLQLLTGTGSIVRHPGSGKFEFWIAQRGPFIKAVDSLSTIVNRPIVNMRDTSLDKDETRKRMHIIPFDTNMNEVACLLKVGLIMIYMQMVEEDAWCRHLELASPVNAFATIASDPTLTKKVHLLTGEWKTGWQLLDAYLSAMKRFFQGRPMTAWQTLVMERFETVTAELQFNIFEAGRTLDWVAKLQLMRGWQQRAHSPEDEWNTPDLRRYDLQYHSFTQQEVVPGDRVGVYQRLRQLGRVDTLFTDAQIAVARPRNTRASIRTLLLNRYGPVDFDAWSMVTLRSGDPVPPGSLGSNWIRFSFQRTDMVAPSWLTDAVRESPTILDLSRRLERIFGDGAGVRDSVIVRLRRDVWVDDDDTTHRHPDAEAHDEQDEYQQALD